MTTATSTTESGMDLRNLLEDRGFARRRSRLRDPHAEVKALRQLAFALATGKDSVIQELVDAAISYCGADSAGISLLETTPSGQQRFRWISIAGSFSKYLQGTTPRNYSPCGTTLDRNAPQLYRVTQPYYKFLGVQADDITDGMLIPWGYEGVRGTLWAVSHRQRPAFCMKDYRLLSSLADFAALAVQHIYLQDSQRRKETIAASSAIANQLAHQINNPLQSLTNALYLAQQGGNVEYVRQASDELRQVTDLVRRLLKISSSSLLESSPDSAPDPLQILSASTARTRRKYRAHAAVA
ncbi:MAG TPA: GAF domain-containing protein [Acidobacteriaceae bacterium]